MTPLSSMPPIRALAGPCLFWLTKRGLCKTGEKFVNFNWKYTGLPVFLSLKVPMDHSFLAHRLGKESISLIVSSLILSELHKMVASPNFFSFFASSLFRDFGNPGSIFRGSCCFGIVLGIVFLCSVGKGWFICGIILKRAWFLSYRLSVNFLSWKILCSLCLDIPKSSKLEKFRLKMFLFLQSLAAHLRNSVEAWTVWWLGRQLCIMSVCLPVLSVYSFCEIV